MKGEGTGQVREGGQGGEKGREDGGREVREAKGEDGRAIRPHDLGEEEPVVDREDEDPDMPSGDRLHDPCVHEGRAASPTSSQPLSSTSSVLRCIPPGRPRPSVRRNSSKPTNFRPPPRASIVASTSSTAQPSPHLTTPRPPSPNHHRADSLLGQVLRTVALTLVAAGHCFRLEIR